MLIVCRWYRLPVEYTPIVHRWVDWALVASRLITCVCGIGRLATRWSNRVVCVTLWLCENLSFVKLHHWSAVAEPITSLATRFVHLQHDFSTCGRDRGFRLVLNGSNGCCADNCDRCGLLQLGAVCLERIAAGCLQLALQLSMVDEIRLQLAMCVCGWSKQIDDVCANN